MTNSNELVIHKKKTCAYLCRHFDAATSCFRPPTMCSCSLKDQSLELVFKSLSFSVCMYK